MTCGFDHYIFKTTVLPLLFPVIGRNFFLPHNPCMHFFHGHSCCMIFFFTVTALQDPPPSPKKSNGQPLIGTFLAGQGRTNFRLIL